MSPQKDASSKQDRQALLAAIDEFKRIDGAGLSDAECQLLERFYREENAELVSILGQFIERHRKHPDDGRRFISNIIEAWNYAITKTPIAQHASFAESMTTAMLATFAKKDNGVVAALTEIVCDLRHLFLASYALLESLEEAYREKDQAKSPIHDPRNAIRFRHSIALRSMTDFLAILGAGQDILDNVASISSALYDVAIGLHPPLFKPHSTAGGRKKDRFEIWVTRAPVVIALRSFVASGISSESKAARLIAEIVKGDANYTPLLRLARSGSALESAILNWHRLLEADSAQPGPGVLVYRKLEHDWRLKISAVGEEPTKEQYRDWALAYLREAAKYASIVQIKRDGKNPTIHARSRMKRGSN
jgi:hypothetical protein